jgi:enoyl-CoA hydratase/carnithine racemase
MPPNDTTPAAVHLQYGGGIATLVVDNAARANALSAAMWGAIPTLIGKAEADPAVRVIVLRGAGERAFSAGADISEFETARSGASAIEYDRLNDNAFNALSRCDKPTIAMIHGFCLGGGLGLALCTDLRLADEKAQFAIPAAKLGIGYNARWVRPLLAAISPSRAKEMLFTGRRFSADEAFAMGLLNAIVPTAELSAKVQALAEEIAANAPLTIRAAKLTIDELTRHPESPDKTALDAAVNACFDSADYAEGRRAFLEKRKPRFEGR